MGNSFLLIVAGLLIFYLVISDKWKCVEGFLACVTGKAATQNNSTGIAPTSAPVTPSTPNVNLTLPPNVINSNIYRSIYGV